jgi:hypothetical protein
VTFYFGKPALGLVSLQAPLKGLTPTNERAATVHVSSNGGRQVDLSPRTRRTFTLHWVGLDMVTFSVLEEFYTGARGAGPFVLLDPGRRNHLTADQSGTASQTNSAAGFAVLAGSGETVAAAVVPVVRGPRSLRWTLPGTVTSGVLDLVPPAGLFGWPTPAGQPWTWSGKVIAPGQAPSVTVTPVLSWRLSDGSEVATTLGTPVVATGAAWQAFSVSLSAPPAGALYVRPQLRVTPGTLFTTSTGVSVLTAARNVARPGPRLLPAVGGNNAPLILTPTSSPWGARGSVIIEQSPILTTDVMVDQLQLDMFGSVRPWALGTGVPQVSMTSLPETYVTLPDRNVVATLIEVG